MSYLCETKTIERIVTYLLSSGLAKFGGITISAAKAADLGQALVKLNVQAFNARYKSNEPVPVYRHSAQPASNTQVLKSVTCLMAQCYEAQSDPVYQDLRSLRDSLALTISTTSPDYEKAEWG